jgi:hypothetical protein
MPGGPPGDPPDKDESEDQEEEEPAKKKKNKRGRRSRKRQTSRIDRGALRRQGVTLRSSESAHIPPWRRGERGRALPLPGDPETLRGALASFWKEEPKEESEEEEVDVKVEEDSSDGGRHEGGHTAQHQEELDENSDLAPSPNHWEKEDPSPNTGGSWWTSEWTDAKGWEESGGWWAAAVPGDDDGALKAPIG